MELDLLQKRLRDLTTMVDDYGSDFKPPIFVETDLRGFAHSKLTMAVYKETNPVEFAFEQAAYMMFLGENICPKILTMSDIGYVMEYLRPVRHQSHSLIINEQALDDLVWNRSLDGIPYAKQIGDESWVGELEKSIGVQIPQWAKDTPCIIHGDPTLDNTLLTGDNKVRIGDPIPPHRLIRPSIKAIDHSKILQSFLGWEAVLRGVRGTWLELPNFMRNSHTARRAVFWCMVALKRIALRNNTSNAGRWAQDVAKELERCM